MNTKALWIAACLGSGAILGAEPWAAASVLHTTAAQANTAGVVNTMLPPGTRIVASMDHLITTKHSHPGDPFTATVVAPVFDANGRVAIPVGAQLAGRVFVAERGHGYHGSSQIALGIDGIAVGGVYTSVAGTVVGADREIWRSGVRQRERSQISPGGRIVVSLQQPVRVADLLRGLPGYGIGGGP